jgi:Protein of unknown function (DUF1595)/Protein of unknown function (DUF1587)/Protein of unknown function (DUF1592)
MRLSVLQWANTVRDLLPVVDPGDLENALTKDAVVRFDNEADSLFVGQALHNDLQSEAERLAGLVVSDPDALGRLIPADAPADLAGRAAAYLRSFGRRAYRRPLSDEELQDYLALFQQGPILTAGLGPFEAGVRVTLEAFLQSIPFLYRTGFGGEAVGGRARLTDYEIAANLAYALTDHPPDLELSAAADRGGSRRCVSRRFRRRPAQAPRVSRRRAAQTLAFGHLRAHGGKLQTPLAHPPGASDQRDRPGRRGRRAGAGAAPARSGARAAPSAGPRRGDPHPGCPRSRPR